ncbi:MAG: transcription termination factor Rho [Lachnospiraceae bacterium]
MRAKLETLSLAVLKDLAKDKGIKNVSTMKKSDLIEEIIKACEGEKTIPAAKEEKTVAAAKEEKNVRETKTAEERSAMRSEPAEEDKYKKRQEIMDQNVVVDKEPADGILEVMPDGYGFIRCENFLPGENDVYVAPSQIRKYGLKTGDILFGKKRVKNQGEKFAALLSLDSVNGYDPDTLMTRPNFENLTPIFPNERIHLEKGNPTTAMRIVDLICPIGKGQRGMIVSQPKAGKTTLLKQIAKAVLNSNPEMHMIILLIDERPEEVTDIKESIVGDNVEVIYSTFDELPERHKRVSEMVIERARRLVEHKKDVIILLDSITRLTRAYNVTVQASGRTLSGGLDPLALHMPKRFFGAARNMREGGSLTILATALIETGSKADDVVFEEFKGTGNMELVLDRKLSEKRVFPAIDIAKSSTRRDDLLLTQEEQEVMEIIRKNLNGMKPDEVVDKLVDTFAKTKNNQEVIRYVKKSFIN